VHHVGILYGQFMMHGQRNIKIQQRRPTEYRGVTTSRSISGRFYCAAAVLLHIDTAF